MSTALTTEARPSRVAIDVADLDAMSAFYAEVLLLDRLEERGDRVRLGRGEQTLVELRHRPDLPRGERRSAGLFHTALLQPDQASLAIVLASVATNAPDLFTGSADHLVSQAFYLDDPEGNGVELYVDRPRDQWSWQDGRVQMDTLWLDPSAFLAEHLRDQDKEFLATAQDRRGALPAQTVVGHVHLKVGNTGQAKDFYVDTLGFDVTAEMFGALFVSAGGYHHHLAMNTWQSAGVGLRAPALGLGRVDLSVPTADDVEQVAGRLADRGLGMRRDADLNGPTVEVPDPWGNLVRIAVAG